MSEVRRVDEAPATPDARRVAPAPAAGTGSRTVRRRTIVKGAAWSIPVIAATAAVPTTAASVRPGPNDAQAVSVWAPSGTGVPGSAGGNTYQAGTTWPLGYAVYKNNGPNPLPAGSTLTVAYRTSAFNNPTVRNSGSGVPGGVGPATYRVDAATGWSYMDVKTLAPIASGATFQLDFTIQSKAGTSGTFNFYGIISPVPAFLDSNAPNNSVVSSAFTLTPNTVASAGGGRWNVVATSTANPRGSNVAAPIATNCADPTAVKGTVSSATMTFSNGQSSTISGSALSTTTVLYNAQFGVAVVGPPSWPGITQPGIPVTFTATVTFTAGCVAGQTRTLKWTANPPVAPNTGIGTFSAA